MTHSLTHSLTCKPTTYNCVGMTVYTHPEGRQVLLGSQATQHHELGRVDGPGTQHHLLPGAYHLATTTTQEPHALDTSGVGVNHDLGGRGGGGLGGKL